MLLLVLLVMLVMLLVVIAELLEGTEQEVPALHMKKTCTELQRSSGMSPSGVVRVNSNVRVRASGVSADFLRLAPLCKVHRNSGESRVNVRTQQQILRWIHRERAGGRRHI
ncbi:unnamed protein product [Pleuronectes platessa]|uniref:Secreted protein n=1 Tax=Pleuronectes platessa TaxID=8262 RepID=A0A9N7UNM4_PLEPL|nr:unnamed protein product [Pleuronectes platessa]